MDRVADVGVIACQFRTEFIAHVFWPSQPHMVALSLFAGFLMASLNLTMVQQRRLALRTDECSVL